MALTQNMGSAHAAKFGTIQSYTAGAEIFRGATVVVKLGNGKVYPAENDTDDSEKQLVVGYAMEYAAADGATVRVRREGKLKRDLAGSPAVVVGRLACIYDDETVQLYGTLTCKVVVGRIVEQPSTTTVYVDLLDQPARLAAGTND